MRHNPFKKFVLASVAALAFAFNGAAFAEAPAVEMREAGAKMPDNSVYAGVSPDTGKEMFAAPKDAPVIMDFYKAGEYCAGLDAQGHSDWRSPTKDELNVLFLNKDKGALKGTFNLSGLNNAGWYWSGTHKGSRYDYAAWSQRFSDGEQNDDPIALIRSSMRCVR